MNDILMTNIFFMITAISSVVTTIMLIIICVYILKLIRKANDITQVVKDETVKIVGDVEQVRTVVHKNMGVVSGLVSVAAMKSLVEKIFNRNNK